MQHLTKNTGTEKRNNVVVVDVVKHKERKRDLRTYEGVVKNREKKELMALLGCRFESI